MSHNTLEATLDLPTAQARINRAERVGSELIALEAMTEQRVNFNRATFEDKIPNDGPYSELRLASDPPPAGKLTVFVSDIFVSGAKTSVAVYR
jgi:hypothetical protein